MFRFLEATTANERMAELERFIEFWYGPRRPEYGNADVTTGYPSLPATLRRFYAFAGRWPSPSADYPEDYFYCGHGGHHLLPFDDTAMAGKNRLRFYREYQGDWYGDTALGEPDPPVWITGWWDGSDDAEETDDGSGTPARTRQVSSALSKFLITHCLMTMTYKGNDRPRSQAQVDAVEQALMSWFDQDSPALMWEAEAGGWPCYEGRFYLVRESVLVHDAGPGSQKVGALRPEGVELLRQVPGDEA